MKPLIALCVFGASLTGAFWAGRHSVPEPAPTILVRESRPPALADKLKDPLDLRDFGVKTGFETRLVWNALQSMSDADTPICGPARFWARAIDHAARTGDSNPRMLWDPSDQKRFRERCAAEDLKPAPVDH